MARQSVFGGNSVTKTSRVPEIQTGVWSLPGPLVISRSLDPSIAATPISRQSSGFALVAAQATCRPSVEKAGAASFLGPVPILPGLRPSACMTKTLFTPRPRA